MKKKILSTICVTLVMALCTMIQAQNIQAKAPNPGTENPTERLDAIPFAHNGGS